MFSAAEAGPELLGRVHPLVSYKGMQSISTPADGGVGFFLSFYPM